MQVRLTTPCAPQFGAGNFAKIEAGRIAREAASAAIKTAEPTINARKLAAAIKRGLAKGTACRKKRAAKNNPDRPKPKRNRIARNLTKDKLQVLGRATAHEEVCGILGRSSDYAGNL